MLCIHTYHAFSPVSPSAIKCNAPHNVYTTQLVVIFDQHEKQGRKNHGDETTAASFASVHGATLAGRVGQWSDRVARQSAACVQRRSALLSRLADTDYVSAGAVVGSSITQPIGLSAVETV